MALFQTSNTVIDPQLVPKKVLLTEGIYKLGGPWLQLCGKVAIQPSFHSQKPWVLPLGQMGQVIEEVEPICVSRHLKPSCISWLVRMRPWPSFVKKPVN